MGNFNDVFRVLCDEAFFLSGKEFVLCWDEKLHNEHSSINESTVNRWKDGTLPRRFYLPKIIKLFAVLGAERGGAGGKDAVSREVRERLLRLCGRGVNGNAPARVLLSKGDRAFLAWILEAAYLSQKSGWEGATEPRSGPERAMKRGRPPLIALVVFVAVGVLGAAGFFIMRELLSASPPVTAQSPEVALPAAGGTQQADPDLRIRLMEAVGDEDQAAARRLILAGAPVEAARYRGNQRRLDFLSRVCRGPLSTLQNSGRIEDMLPDWGVYWGEHLPGFSLTRMTPGTGRAILRLSLLRGEPYSYAHFYLNLKPPRRPAGRLMMRVCLSLAKETTFNNEHGDSIVQALELSANCFDKKRRYEFAWQWDNVGEGAPQWRFWDPVRGWTATGLPQRLAPKTWHEISFTGGMAGNNVYYDTLTVDGETHTVGKTAAAAPLDGTDEYLAAAVQLDGNYQADPYDVYVRDFSLETTP